MTASRYFANLKKPLPVWCLTNEMTVTDHWPAVCTWYSHHSLSNYPLHVLCIQICVGMLAWIDSVFYGNMKEQYWEESFVQLQNTMTDHLLNYKMNSRRKHEQDESTEKCSDTIAAIVGLMNSTYVVTMAIWPEIKCVIAEQLRVHFRAMLSLVLPDCAVGI